MTTAAQQTEAQRIAKRLRPFVGGLGLAILRELEEALAQPAQQPVNAELLEALQQARAEIWRLLDAKGIDPKQARQWPEIIILEAAIAKTTGETT